MRSLRVALSLVIMIGFAHKGLCDASNQDFGQD